LGNHFKNLTMTKLLSFLSAIILLLASCKKNNTPAVLNDTLPEAGTTIVAGNFISSVHASSGTVKVTKDAANKIYLVFENFKTDNGPDLRIWLSPNNTGNPYQEVGLLKAVSGNFSYQLDASFNYSSNNRVLIWCKQFSVLFGYAVLQ
jgi:Electron transfer DM13